MRFRLAYACALTVLIADGAMAQVTGLVTDSTVDVALTPGSRPGGNFHYEGILIDGTNTDNSVSGASYTSRSEVDGGEILFVNGNATAGSYSSATSLTRLDVTYTNDGPDAVDTILRSTLLPAGFGMFVAPGACASGPVTSCFEAVGGPGFATLPYNGPRNFGPLAFAAFEFDILSDGRSLFSLTGTLALVFDQALGRNVIVTDIGDAANVLRGFSQVTPADSPTALAFVWDSTDIDLSLGVLGAGESRVLTYTTSTTTLTRSFGADGCGLVAFSEFGDPIGRGGSIPPPALTARAASPCSGGAATGLTLQRPSLFRFPVPTFEDGVLTVLASAVPEPATWSMMIIGFGLAGAVQRRRRTVPA